MVGRVGLGCFPATCRKWAAFFFLYPLTLQVHLSHIITHAHTYSAQARPTPIRRGCTWLRDIRSYLGFVRDMHVTLTIVTHPRVRLLKNRDTAWAVLEKKPGETPTSNPWFERWRAASQPPASAICTTRSSQ
jgi:hypothetical protein